MESHAERQLNVEEHTNKLLGNRNKKTKQYWDSADWMLELSKGNTAYNETLLVNKELPTSEEVEELAIVEVRDKENWEAKRAKFRMGHNNPQRKFFDSADWMLTGQAETYQTYPMFAQPNAASVLTKKKMSKSRQYFDSADWAMNNCLPQIQPKLMVLKS